MADQTVSVVIPTCNRGQFLARALRSVRAQTHPPDHIVIVHDGADAGRKLEIPEGLTGADTSVILNSRRRGASGARNCGAEFASTRLLALLDDDDEWLPDYLAEVLGAARDHRANLVCASFVARSGEGPDVDEKSAPDRISVEAFLHHNDGMRGSNILIGRSLYLELGGFDEELPSLNDLDFAIRIAECEQVRYWPVRRRLVRFNNHDGPRLSTPCCAAKRHGVRNFYLKYAERMTEIQAIHFRAWVRAMWSVDELGNIVGHPGDAADGTSQSRAVT